MLQIRIRPELRRAIHRLAAERGETSQSFVLRILQEHGVPVLDEDLVDLRKGEYRGRRAFGDEPDAVCASESDRLLDVIDRFMSSRGTRRDAIAMPVDGANPAGLTLIINNYPSRDPDP